MRKLFILLFLSTALAVSAQEVKLAQQYYGNGEYEKAASLYQKLLIQNDNNEYYFNRYIECLLALQDFDNGEKITKRQIKKYPKEVKGRLIK